MADKRVLVAEDNTVSRRILCTFLTKKGFEVVDVPDGDQAWEITRRDDTPRLLLLDWLMPGQNGLDLCFKLKLEAKTRPFYIILLTAKNEKQDIIKGLNNGADDYIRKPFDPEELEARIKVGFRYLTLQEQLHAEMKKLREALEHIRTLQGLLPICMHCHKIRDDEGYWEKLEVYIEDRSLAEFSHSICPDCMEKIYGEPDQRKKSSAAEGSC